MTHSLKLILSRSEAMDSSALADLTEINDDDLIEDPNVTISTFVQTKNEVSIQFAERKPVEGTGPFDSEEGENMAIDIKEGIVMSDDLANKDLRGMVDPETYRLMMFAVRENAQWAADRYLSALAFPPYEISIVVNRNSFRLEPGNLFKWTNAKYGVTDMIMRITSVVEDEFDSENIVISAARDPNYITTQYSYSGTLPEGNQDPNVDSYALQPLRYVAVDEAPYIISGDNIAIIPAAAKMLGIESGYLLYYSVDGGSSYSLLSTIDNFNPHGILVDDYPKTRQQIDDEIGFTVDASYNGNWSNVQSITRTNLLAGKNVAILGDEIISIQTITPHAEISGRYFISGVWGGRFDTRAERHYAGEHFYFFGDEIPSFSNANMVSGFTMYFKFIPFSGNAAMSISQVPSISLTFAGRAKKPYSVSNLMANGELSDAIYSGDVVLEWDARSRSSGAGTQLPEAPDDPDTWEGYFRVKVYQLTTEDSSGAVYELVRTKDGVDAQTWTYTEDMNLADGDSSGAGLAPQLRFFVTNYIEDVGTGQEFESDSRMIEVDLVPP